MLKTYSFDVFDTCLTRTFLRPTDLFFALGQKIAKDNGFEVMYSWGSQFAAHRIYAERDARKKSSKHDVSHEEIYTQFKWLNQFGLNPDLIRAEEMDFECRCFKPIKRMRERIESLRKDGHEQGVIAGMYLH